MLSRIRFPDTKLNILKEKLNENPSIVIIPHHRPDGDAIGASLGLFNYLKSKGIASNVIIPSSFPDFLAWMEGTDTILDAEKEHQKATDLIANAGLIFCLDFNAPNRVNHLEEALVSSKAFKVLIDHHLDPVSFCDLEFCISDAPATAELIMDLILAMDDEELLNRDIAECLYAGIMTDTGSFRFESVTAHTHYLTARLIKSGTRNFRIHEWVYDNYNEQRLRLLGYCLSEKLVVLPEFRTAYMTLSKEEMDRFDYQEGDTEGIVNYGLSIKNIVMAALFTEKHGMIRISFRSLGDFSVKELSNAHFDGGGHRNAAGGRSKDDMIKTIERFKAALPEFKDKLMAQ